MILCYDLYGLELDPPNINGIILMNIVATFVHDNGKIFKGVSTYIIYIKILLIVATIVTRHTDHTHLTSLTSGRRKSLYCE